MAPELFHIGSFPIRSFGVAMIAAFVVAVVLARRRAPRYGIPSSKVWDLSFWVLIFGVLGARLGFILQELPHYRENPSELFSPKFEGLTSFGGMIAGFLVVWIWCRIQRISMASILDVFAVPFLVAHAIGRVGCLLNGCCYGGPTELPWGVQVIGLPGLYEPAQLYDAFMTLIGAGVLSLIEKKKDLASGQSFGLMLVVYGMSRFIFEFWRAGSSSTYWGSLPITQAHAMALVLITCGVLVFVFSRRYATRAAHRGFGA